MGKRGWTAAVLLVVLGVLFVAPIAEAMAAYDVSIYWNDYSGYEFSTRWEKTPIYSTKDVVVMRTWRCMFAGGVGTFIKTTTTYSEREIRYTYYTSEVGRRTFEGKGYTGRTRTRRSTAYEFLGCGDLSREAWAQISQSRSTYFEWMPRF